MDVVQIDDGWQKGRSSNSANAKGSGVWNGYWAADRGRFPNGLDPVVKPLVVTWKKEWARMHGGAIVPVGSAPDGVVWTGFASAAADGKGRYVLLFRERNQRADFSMDLPLLGNPSRATVIGGRGTARFENGRLAVNVPDMLDFIWVKIERGQPTPT